MESGSLREARERCRRRVAADLPEMLALQSQARRRVAGVTRGLSEQAEALGHHLASVRTKAERMKGAEGAELIALLEEFEAGWEEVDRCASGIRAALAADREDREQPRDPTT